ncbi:MAG: hypothetical protein WC853_02880 [Thermodesulfovibrionales bacterium]
MILKEFVILAKAGIQVFQWVLDPPVKPEDDKSRLNTQTLNTVKDALKNPSNAWNV